jgi:predicted dehydrogenase
MKIRVGIVGFGFMGQMHARIYQALPDVEIVGIADFSAEGVRQAAAFGLNAPIVSSLAVLLKQIDCNVIDICLPTDLHAEAIFSAACAGKHIFCEKPLALEIAEAERALAAVKENDVTLQVGQCIRFWPEYQALEQFVKSGRGGRLTSLSLQRRASRPTYSRENWLLDARRSKGAALDLHIHDTDYVLHLLGMPRAVHSIGHREGGEWTRLFTHYLFNDVAVSAEGAWDLPPQWGFQMSFQAVFEKAVIEFDTRSTPTLHLTMGKEQRQPLAFQKPVVTSSGPTGGNISELGGYYNELAYFCGKLREGKKPEIATGCQALTSLHVVLAEIESASRGETVVL